MITGEWSDFSFSTSLRIVFTSSILGHLKYKNSCVRLKSFLVSIYFHLNRKGKLLLPTVGEAIALLESAGTSFVLPSLERCLCYFLFPFPIAYWKACQSHNLKKWKSVSGGNVWCHCDVSFNIGCFMGLRFCAAKLSVFYWRSNCWIPLHYCLNVAAFFEERVKIQ